ncbi:MAG TPA: SAM-dependent methyltransferase, partial [Clostridia bacterium]|nr:SAM-dependent methyltransferase [Clostridia bacterium]
VLRLKNAQILKQDIFKTDLSKATVVNLYLLQSTNEKLEKKLKKELKKGTRVISTAFTFPGLKPLKVSPRGTIYGPVYLYEV